MCITTVEKIKDLLNAIQLYRSANMQKEADEAAEALHELLQSRRTRRRQLLRVDA